MIRQPPPWPMLILIPGMVMPLPAHGADADEIARLMQAFEAFEALEAQNEAMAARLSALESQQATATAPAPAATSDQADGTADQEHLARRVTELEAARVDQEQVMRAVTTEKAALEQRVRELETAQAVRNEAFRSLVMDKERLERKLAELETKPARSGPAGPVTDGRPGPGAGVTAGPAAPDREPLVRRVAELEDAKTRQDRTIETLSRDKTVLERRVIELESDAAVAATLESHGLGSHGLEQRVSELESARHAQEDATRAIIRDAMTSVGSNINDAVALGGTLEVVAGRSEDFDGISASEVLLNTAELDLELSVNDWTRAGMVIEYDDGRDVSFLSTGGFEESVDRINLDTAFITIGDPQRFPPYLTAGRIILPFGISTGNPVADVLTIEDPLTISGFEQRQVAIGIGAEFPTPSQTPPLPVTPPPVQPQVLKPGWDELLGSTGLKVPTAYPSPPAAIVPPPEPPRFNLALYTFNGDTFTGKQSGWHPGDHFNLTFGYRTGGHCGRPYDELEASDFCPWTLDLDIDYNSSVFDSRFMRREYRQWLGAIGLVPGVAASLKSTLGPLSLVGEWNGAIGTATFTDDARNRVSISPGAWQVSLGYQLDWNPWLEAVGAQGTYLAMSYSESRDFGGVRRDLDGERSRVGFLPKRRLLIGAGEWFMDGIKLAIEYSRDWDYS